MSPTHSSAEKHLTKGTAYDIGTARHQNGKVVDWMEQVSDEQYKA